MESHERWHERNSTRIVGAHSAQKLFIPKYIGITPDTVGSTTQYNNRNLMPIFRTFTLVNFNLQMRSRICGISRRTTS